MRNAPEAPTPENLADEFTLATAVTRLDFLRRRDNGDPSLNTVAGLDEDDWSAIRDGGTSLDVHESLELLALGEVIARKAHDSRQVGIRAALRGGAGWEEIAGALGVTPQQAWDGYARDIREQVDRKVLDAGAADAARALAGARP